MPSSPRPHYPVSQFLRDIAGFVRPYRGKFWLGFVLRLTSDLAWLYPAYGLSRLVGLLGRGEYSVAAQQEFFWIVGLWAAAAGWRFLAHDLAKYFGFQVAENIALDARLRAIRHLFRLDLTWHEKENSGNKLKRIDNGSRGLNQIMRIFYVNIIESTINIVGISILLTTLGGWLGGATIGFIVVYYLLSYKLTKRAADQAYRVHKHEEQLEGLNFESVNNIRTVKSLGIFEAILKFTTQAVDRTKRAILRRILLFRIRSSILNFFSGFFELSIIGVLGWSVLSGNAELSLLVLFIGYFKRIESSTFEISEITNEIVVAKAGVDRQMAILDQDPASGESDKIRHYPRDWQQLELRRVKFGYGDEPHTLREINLTIRRGEKVGIVGLSGAGKSTLFNLLLDLYQDYEGEILLDHTPLREIDRRAYIDHLAVVLQDTELFNATLRDNITLAGVEGQAIDDAALQQIIESAHLAGVVARLPQGLDTPIGEKGVKLSGGERQRLGIARALYRQPDLLLLDEATSHLDATSEREIQASLERFFQKVTAIVIAHRLSTLRAMDRIVVLEAGRIVQSGSFDQLANTPGPFAILWKNQQLG